LTEPASRPNQASSARLQENLEVPSRPRGLPWALLLVNVGRQSTGLAAFQIDGVFVSTDLAPLLRFLRSRSDIRITETESRIEIERQ
jgi:hypothetical protein